MTECSPSTTQATFPFFHPQRVTVTFDEGAMELIHFRGARAAVWAKPQQGASSRS
jgi:hypothetical protein